MMQGSRTLWEEMPAPEAVRACVRCELARQRARVIWGEGRADAPLLLILDNPGAREDASGRPFVCGTRSTLMDALEESGLTTDQVCATYLLKCRPRRAYARAVCRDACAGYLERQIASPAVRVLVLFGNVVVQTLFSAEADVCGLRGRWLELQGKPAVVTYHPLAARRRPNLFPLLVEDLRLAGTGLR